VVGSSSGGGGGGGGGGGSNAGYAANSNGSGSRNYSAVNQRYYETDDASDAYQLSPDSKPAPSPHPDGIVPLPLPPSLMRTMEIASTTSAVAAAAALPPPPPPPPSRRSSPAIRSSRRPERTPLMRRGKNLEGSMTTLQFVPEFSESFADLPPTPYSNHKSRNYNDSSLLGGDDSMARLSSSFRYKQQHQHRGAGGGGGGALGRSMEGSFSFLTLLGEVPEGQDDEQPPSPAAQQRPSVPLNEKDFMMSFANWSISDSGAWTCVACTYLNTDPLHLTCEVCGQKRPTGKDAANQCQKAMQEVFETSIRTGQHDFLRRQQEKIEEVEERVIAAERVDEILEVQQELLEEFKDDSRSYEHQYGTLEEEQHQEELEQQQQQQQQIQDPSHVLYNEPGAYYETVGQDGHFQRNPRPDHYEEDDCNEMPHPDELYIRSPPPHDRHTPAAAARPRGGHMASPGPDDPFTPGNHSLSNDHGPTPPPNHYQSPPPNEQLFYRLQPPPPPQQQQQQHPLPSLRSPARRPEELYQKAELAQEWIVQLETVRRQEREEQQRVQEVLERRRRQLNMERMPTQIVHQGGAMPSDGVPNHHNCHDHHQNPEELEIRAQEQMLSQWRQQWDARSVAVAKIRERQQSIFDKLNNG
jgi:hypothetical protein